MRNFLRFVFLCWSTVAVARALPPTGTIGISSTASVCQNSPGPVITFTGSGGSAPYTFTYTVNGGAQQIATTLGSLSVATVNGTTATAGTMVYNLVSVSDSSGSTNIGSSVTYNVVSSAFAVNAGNNITVCKGNAINLISSVTGNGTSAVTFSWTGPNGYTSSAQSPIINNATGVMSGTYTVTASIGGCQVQDSLNVTVITVGAVDPSSLNGCIINQGTTSMNVALTLAISNPSAIQTISINWGDSPTVTVPQSNWNVPQIHNYPIGVYTVTISATTNLGCSVSQSYAAFVGSSPQAATMSLFANQASGCSPHTTNFTLTIPTANNDGTNYQICFGDNSSCINYVHGTNVPSDWIPSGSTPSSNSYTLTHVYNITSCGNSVNLNGTVYNNSFLPSVITTNPCTTPQPQAGSLISISQSPTASFTPNPIPTTCINTAITLNNTSDFGGVVTSNPTCTTSPFYWTISPSTPGLWTATGLGSNNNNPDQIGWTVGSMTPTITFLQAGNYTITLTIKNNCGSSTVSHNICVEAPLVPQFVLNTTTGCTSLAVTATNTTNFSGLCTPATNTWSVTYVSGFCGSTNPNIPNQTTPNANFNFTEPGTYTITLTTTNSCGSTSTSQTVTVKKPPTASINPISNLCGSGSITPTATVVSCSTTALSALTYNWSFPGGTPSSSTAQNPGAISYAVAGSYTVSLTVSNECGSSATATQTLTVNQAPTITNTNLNQTICSGNSTTAINLTSNLAGTTYTWAGVQSSGVSGGQLNGTGATIPAQALTYVGSGTGTLTYTVTPSVSGCAGSAVTIVINVTPAPTITAQPQPQTLCQNAPAAAMVFAINPGSATPTYQWYSNSSNSNTGGTLIPGATASSFTPPANTTGTFFYYAVASLGAGGCSALTSNAAQVTVTALPQISSQPMASQTVCVGGSIPTLSAAVTGGTGTVTYQWYASATNSNTAGSPIGGANQATYTPPAFSTVGDSYFYVVATLSGAGCGNTTSQVAHVSVLPDPTLTTQPIASQVLCQNASPQVLTVAASGGSIASFTYQWYSNATNNNTGGNAISGANGPTYSPPTANVGTVYYYCVVSQSTAGCAVTSATATVIVNTSPSVTAQPVSTSVCVGGAVPALSFTTANGQGTATYQWFSNTTPTNAGGTLLAGQTNATFTPDSALAGTFYYYAQITFSGISGSCATIATQAATINVNPAATFSVQPTSSQTICVGGSVPAFAASVTGGTGSVSYQWYSNGTNSAMGGSLIPGANQPTYTPPAFNTAGDFYFYVVATLSGAGCGNATSQVAHISILPDPTMSAQPVASQVLCQNAAPQILSITATGGTATPFSYQWYSNANNNTTGGSAILGANATTFSPPTANVGTVYYYCIVTQPESGCSATSAVSAVTVTTSPSVVLQPLSSEVCVDGTIQALSFTTSNGQGSEMYQWFSNSSPVNSGGNPIAGQTGATFTPDSSVAGIFYYYAEITFSGISGSCATIATPVATVTVLPPATISTQPVPAQQICVGGTLAAPLSVAYTGGSGTPTYTWYSTASNVPGGGTVVGTNSNSFTPAVFTTPGTYYYYVSIQFAASGCDPAVSQVAQVEVLADPVVTAEPYPSQTLCPNEIPTMLSVTVSGGISAAYEYQWYQSSTPTGTGAPIAGATGASFDPPTGAAGTLYYYCVITQPSSSSCNAQSAIAAVTISPAPQVVTQPQPQTICGGQSLNPLSLMVSNGVGTPSYQWYSNASAVNTGGNAIVGATSATYLPDNTTVGIFYYYATVTFPDLTGNCSSVSTDAIQISINQNPIISNQNETICSSATFTVTPATSGTDIVPAGTTFTWPAPVVSPAGAVTGSSAQTTPETVISQQLVNVTVTPATVTYTVTPQSGNCAGTPFQVSVIVNPAINPNVTINDNLCFGADNASITTNVTGGIPFPTGQPYLFNWTGPNGFSSSAPSISNLEPGLYSVTIDDAGGCPFSQTYTISEPTEMLFGTTSKTDVTCNNFADGTITVSVNGGTPGYTFSWTKDTAPFSTNQNLTGLAPGVYEVTVSDVNNCGPIAMSFTITEPLPLVAALASQTNVQCFGANTGAVSISVTGGTQIELTPGVFGYNYAWTGPNGFTSTDQNISNLFAGDYSLVVTDANNCQTNFSATITQNPEIVISYTATEITCYGANDANLSVSITGGIAPYTFTWSNMATILNQTNLSAGDYTIIVTDALGCVKSRLINIPEAPIFTVNPVVTQISCHGEHDGSIQLNLVGGIAPISLVWSDASPDGLTRNNLGPGTYSVTITDSKPCVIERTFIIVEPQPLVLSAQIDNADDCNNANGGAIDLLVSGGTPPYTYAWSTGSTAEDLTQLTNGSYAVAVTDSRGCMANAQYTVVRPDPIAISVATQTDFDCETHTVSQDFVATVSGGVPPYQIQWSSGIVTGTNNEIMHTEVNGLVTITATDALGCSMQYPLDVDIPELGYIDYEPESFGNEHYGIFSVEDPITFESTITGDYQTIVWDFGDGTFSNEVSPIHTYVNPGSYVVTQTVTYPFGCTYTKVITLLVEEGYFLTIPTAFTPNNDSLNDNYRPVSKRLESIRMDIYDSWGSMIFSETGDVLVGWDGKIKSVGAENGNYYCKITAKTFYGRLITETRTFVLIK